MTLLITYPLPLWCCVPQTNVEVPSLDLLTTPASLFLVKSENNCWINNQFKYINTEDNSSRNVILDIKSKEVNMKKYSRAQIYQFDVYIMIFLCTSFSDKRRFLIPYVQDNKKHMCWYFKGIKQNESILLVF